MVRVFLVLVTTSTLTTLLQTTGNINKHQSIFSRKIAMVELILNQRIFRGFFRIEQAQFMEFSEVLRFVYSFDVYVALLRMCVDVVCVSTSLIYQR